MKVFLISIFAIFLIGPIADAMGKECLLTGKWKSNEKKTLENVAKSNLTDKQKKALSNGFFGKLIVVNTCEDFTTYFEGEKEVTKFISLKEEGNVVITEYYNELYQSVIKRELTLSGNCYTIELDELGFSEVFCRID